MSTDPRTHARRPAGVPEPIRQGFNAAQIANAFGVELERVHNAMRGEFDYDPHAMVNDKQAQHLAEVLLGDQPLDRREAALMTLGAFTQRADRDWGLGDKAPGEESDRLQHEDDRFDDTKLGTDAGDEKSQ